jgi:hypothetical protein
VEEEMISIMPELKSCWIEMSFPPSKIIVRNISDFQVDRCVDICINIPDLYHWVLVSVSNTEISELAKLTELPYRVASYLKLHLYTIITAKNRKALKRKSNFYVTYVRSYNRDRLSNLKWTSSKICANDFDEIVSFTSPIQLFGSYRGYNILYVWVSGFRSIIANGYLEVRLSFYCFSLGSGYN